MRIVIVGYGEMFTNLIAGALDADCEIVGVLRKEAIKTGKSVLLKTEAGCLLQQKQLRKCSKTVRISHLQIRQLRFIQQLRMIL